MAIVTISCEMGSGGSEIGAALAERLGYHFVDPELIAKAAREYGVGEERLTQLDEAKPGLFERFDAETRHYLTVLECAVLDVAEQDNCVIMGRSGQVLLRGISHVLRVFIRAPVTLRVKRVMNKLARQISETVDARTTADMVRRADQEKVGRLRYLFDVDWRDSTLYDLVLDTERLTTEAAVDLLVKLAQRPELVATAESRQAVRDRALASRVLAALAADGETRKYRITVDADQGVIRLEGTGALERAGAVARGVPGVADVKEELLDIPPIPPFVA
jgi:cytidylate kinase